MYPEAYVRTHGNTKYYRGMYNVYIEQANSMFASERYNTYGSYADKILKENQLFSYNNGNIHFTHFVPSENRILTRVTIFIVDFNLAKGTKSL